MLCRECIQCFLRFCVSAGADCTSVTLTPAGPIPEPRSDDSFDTQLRGTVARQSEIARRFIDVISCFCGFCLKFYQVLVHKTASATQIQPVLLTMGAVGKGSAPLGPPVERCISGDAVSYFEY